MSGEFGRIARYFAPLAAEEALGLTDDAALWSPPAGEEMVLTTDQMIEGVHFLPDDPPDCVARKLLRRNLSDLAAMGARPRGYLLTTALRRETPEAWLAAFANGLAVDQQRYGIALWGGDSSLTPGPVTTSVTMIGTVARGAALRRVGARAGDTLFVTGTIGDAVLGLHAARGDLADPSGHFRNRRLLPEPRIGLPLAGIAHAVIDVSDGLVQDIGHVCAASGVGAVIEIRKVPLSAAARDADPAWRDAMLTGGDDYELVIAAPAAAEAALRAACCGVSLTAIGRFEGNEPEVLCLDETGARHDFARPGWQHF